MESVTLPDRTPAERLPSPSLTRRSSSSERPIAIKV